MAEKIKNPLLLYKRSEPYLETYQIKHHRKALLHKELHESGLFFKNIPNFPVFS